MPVKASTVGLSATQQDMLLEVNAEGATAKKDVIAWDDWW